MYVSDGRAADFIIRQPACRSRPTAPDRRYLPRPGRLWTTITIWRCSASNLGQQRQCFRANGEPPAEHEPPAGLYHLAWEVDSLEELERIRHQPAERGILKLEEDHGVHKR